MLKGSQIKKIVDCGHNRSPHHGVFKDWDKLDIQRLLRIMVTQEFLREDLIFSKDIPQAYIYLGTRVEVLMKENLYINFALTRKETVKSNLATAAASVSVSNGNGKENSILQEQLRNINERCYSDLLDLCRTIAAERNATMASIMNIRALKAMAEQLPETEADMCSIPHVTKANYDKYGAQMLEITRKFAGEKLFLLMSFEESKETENNKIRQTEKSTSSSKTKKVSSLFNDDMDSHNSDDIEEDWALMAANQGNAAGRKGGSSFNNFKYRGGKRKRSYRGGNKSKSQKTATSPLASNRRGRATGTKPTKSTTNQNWIVTKKQSIFQFMSEVNEFLINTFSCRYKWRKYV